MHFIKDLRLSAAKFIAPKEFYESDFRMVDGLLLPPDWHKGDLAPQSTLLRPVGEPLRPIRGSAEMLYIIYNSATSLTSQPVKQPTGTAITTMLQLTPNANCNIKIIEWGVSFDGTSGSATPGEWVLIDTTSIFATMSTAHATADIGSYNLSAIAQNGATTAGFPLQIGTALTGFATTTVTEGTTTVSRVGDIQLLPATAPYVKQYPLSREFEHGGNHALRVRCLTAATVNCYIYAIFAA